MHRAIDRELLLQASAILDLLEIGWRPAKPELEHARYFEKWAVLSSGATVGPPFWITGVAWSLPVRCTSVTSALLALDQAEGWARLWEEWVVIGEPLHGWPQFDPAGIRAANIQWLACELAPVSAPA